MSRELQTVAAGTLGNMKVVAYVALGSNLGDSQSIVLAAIKELSEKPGLRLLAQSGLFSSKPHEASGADYVNAVIALECSLNALELLQVTQDMELGYGRLRSFVNAPRTLDLDLIFYGSAKIQSPWLVVPHPRWAERAFVLKPLHCIAPHLVTHEMLEKVSAQVIERI